MSGFDWLIVIVYLAIVVALGLWVGRNEEGMDDYFLGGRAIPWWAALMSMVATEISAATFLGAPEQGLTRNLTYLQFGIGSILARFALAFLFLGVYYKLNVYTVYGFLAHRFGPSTKSAAAGMFLLGRVFAGGSRLFIASLAVKVAVGLPMAHSIIALGLIAVVYTLFGGIKAVIWTDVMQAVVLIGGAIVTIYTLLTQIPLSSGEILGKLSAANKFTLFDTSSSVWTNAYHVFPAILGGFVLTMATHGTDQAMVQRMLTCKDSTKSKLSMVASGFLGVGVTCLFMMIGMLLFIYVQTIPQSELAATAAALKAQGKNGDLFLHYIVKCLPAGLTGLIIAAVFAAAMSSIDSELNAMSATFVNDFYLPWTSRAELEKDKERGKDEVEKTIKIMKVAKIATVVSGIFLIGLALLIADFHAANPKTDLLSIALGIMTFFYGGLLGIFLVGLLTDGRGSETTTIAGLLLSTVLVVAISKSGLGLAWPWFIIIGTSSSMLIALLGKSDNGNKVVNSASL